MRFVTMIRQAARHLRRTPVTTLAFVCLAGASLGAFLAAESSLRTIEGLAHRFPAPEHLVHVARLHSADSTCQPVSRVEFADWRARKTVL